MVGMLAFEKNRWLYWPISGGSRDEDNIAAAVAADFKKWRTKHAKP